MALFVKSIKNIIFQFIHNKNSLIYFIIFTFFIFLLSLQNHHEWTILRLHHHALNSHSQTTANDVCHFRQQRTFLH